MASYLAAALGRSDSAMNSITAELESSVGFLSEDSRLVSEIISDVNLWLSRLGLDESDTNAEELYHALIEDYTHTSRQFARAIGEKYSDGLLVRYGRLSRLLPMLAIAEPVWALKNQAIVKLLKAHAPKKLAKALGYRSVESMVKREDASMLLAAAYITESSRWAAATDKAVEKLQISSFDLKKPRVLVMPEKLWSGAAGRRPLVHSQARSAVVIVWPNQLAGRISSLAVTGLCLKELARLCDISQALGRRKMMAGFGRSAVVLWSNKDEAFTSHANKPAASRASRSLGRLHPAAGRWSGCSHLVFVDRSGKAVSLNLIDNAYSHAVGAGFDRRCLEEAQSALRAELLYRYSKHQGASEPTDYVITFREPTRKPSFTALRPSTM